MDSRDITSILTETVGKLSEGEALGMLFHRHSAGDIGPSGKALHRIVELARAILFPGYYGNTRVDGQTIAYHIGVNVEELYSLMAQQIEAGLAHAADEPKEWLEQQAKERAAKFVSKLPELRRTLATDVEAAYNGDPAATSKGEIIYCYPAIRAITNYRIAHELLLLGVPLIPRIITEMAHSETGIDIHPGAKIGNYFTIDHGTGVVIGETCIIGNNVKLYQGVTLGAKSFPLDEKGNPIKGIARHPIIGDNVIIYSNATILGRITIGQGAVVGGNIWVTENVEPGARIVQRK